MVTEEKILSKRALLVKENHRPQLLLLIEGDVDLIFSGGGEGAIITPWSVRLLPGRSGRLIVDRTIDIHIIRPDHHAGQSHGCGRPGRARPVQVDKIIGYVMMRNVAALYSNA